LPNEILIRFCHALRLSYLLIKLNVAKSPAPFLAELHHQMIDIPVLSQMSQFLQLQRGFHAEKNHESVTAMMKLKVMEMEE
jgi:hypothetical protein